MALCFSALLMASTGADQQLGPRSGQEQAYD
jgi:hypothetical protein